MAAYYNELDPHAAAWLRELIKRGLIAAGDVDERSIEDVKPGDLRGYRQCHFFAGIGGWSYALRLAGWPDDQPVWTGSCPCQPFSAAGKRAGFEDERHLWPAWFHLIRQCSPAVVYGEQVASRDGLDWLDLVQADLEGAGYASGAADLCAAGVGAPHIRQRLWFVADADGGNARTQWQQSGGQYGLVTAYGGAVRQARSGTRPEIGVARGDANVTRLEGRQLHAERAGELAARPPGVAGQWHNPDWLPCFDGKARPVEPGTFPLAHGIPARVVRLRGYGNAINPEVAAAFICAHVASRSERLTEAA